MRLIFGIISAVFQGNRMSRVAIAKAPSRLGAKRAEGETRNADDAD